MISHFFQKHSSKSAHQKAAAQAAAQQAQAAPQPPAPAPVPATNWAPPPAQPPPPAAPAPTPVSQHEAPAASNSNNLFEPLNNHPRYVKIRDLNEGTFGFVQLARDKQMGQEVAIKFLERGAGISRSVLREILNHRLCVVHPHIVQFKEVFLTAQHLAIVMEFAAGGDMFDYVIKHKAQGVTGVGLPEDTARWFFQQLIVALDFCHELGIANRDIKLENTLLDGSLPRPNVKICDFGYSKNEFVDSRPKTVSGTPDYIAPEVLLHDQYDGKTADIWSCGVMLYVMLTGVLPFAKRGDDRGNNLVRLQQMFPRIVAADFEAPRHVSPECLNLLRGMLTADPAKRITIMQILNHPWFLKDLPEGKHQMNYNMLQGLVPPGLQGVDEIEAIVQQGTQPGVVWPNNWAPGQNQPEQLPQGWGRADQ
ncbi:hypothetical protein WJX72_005481 [[Myrmecia] bisecta]|uniref:Protein kinase domain-containing protein n=1 Tax=[Myrmecia] bisecta TaxID=41462 RepID=A0AAW1PH60_9CHLO